MICELLFWREFIIITFNAWTKTGLRIIKKYWKNFKELVRKIRITRRKRKKMWNVLILKSGFGTGINMKSMSLTISIKFTLTRSTKRLWIRILSLFSISWPHLCIIGWNCQNRASLRLTSWVKKSQKSLKKCFKMTNVITGSPIDAGVSSSTNSNNFWLIKKKRANSCLLWVKSSIHMKEETINFR